MTSEIHTPDYWNAIYREEESPGWNLGRAAPPLARWLQGDPRLGRILVPGCGFGHDARLLAAHGFDVVALDFAPLAIAGARRLAEAEGVEQRIEFRQGDLFQQPESQAATFDYVFEHTCFCAVSPDRREEYADVVAALLRPGGKLIGLFYAHGREGGPPFHCAPDDVRAVFSGRFEIRRFEITPHSVERRQGLEYWAEFDKR